MRVLFLHIIPSDDGPANTESQASIRDRASSTQGLFIDRERLAKTGNPKNRPLSREEFFRTHDSHSITPP